MHALLASSALTTAWLPPRDSRTEQIVVHPPQGLLKINTPGRDFTFLRKDSGAGQWWNITSSALRAANIKWKNLRSPVHKSVRGTLRAHFRNTWEKTPCKELAVLCRREATPPVAHTLLMWILFYYYIKIHYNIMLILFYDGCEFQFYPQIGEALGNLGFIPKFQFGGLKMLFYFIYIIWTLLSDLFNIRAWCYSMKNARVLVHHLCFWSKGRW